MFEHFTNIQTHNRYIRYITEIYTIIELIMYLAITRQSQTVFFSANCFGCGWASASGHQKPEFYAATTIQRRTVCSLTSPEDSRQSVFYRLCWVAQSRPWTPRTGGPAQRPPASIRWPPAGLKTENLSPSGVGFSASHGKTRANNNLDSFCAQLAYLVNIVMHN